MNYEAGNPGLVLALPITLGLILLIMISILVAFILLVTRKRQMFEKWVSRKTAKTAKESVESNLKVRTISNKSDNVQQQQQQQQQVRLFPSKEVPTRVHCGLLRCGDIYYEQESAYQAGKLSREAVDLMSHWLESCATDGEGRGTIVTSVDARKDNLRPKSEPVKMEIHNLSKHTYESLKKVSSVVDEMEVGKEKASCDGMKRLSTADSTSDLSKNKRKTYVAMYPLTSSSRDELNLFANDVIYYLGEKKKGWLKGEKKESGEIGWFPRSHVREGMNQAPDTSMYVSDPTDDDDFDDGDGNDDDVDDGGDGDSSIFECVVKHAYEATYDGDLPLKIGEVVLVRETLENGWWRGDSDGRSGFFPGNYVEVCDNNSLVTRSCVNLSEEEKKFNSSVKRNFPGKQFIQKLSTINLGTLRKVKPKRKIRRESVKAMGRMPVPLPRQESNTETEHWDRQITTVSYRDESKTSSNLDLASTHNSDLIYGNLPGCSAKSSVCEDYDAAKMGPSQKPSIFLKQKIAEAVEPSKTPSSALDGKNKISLNFQRNSGTLPSPLSNGHCSTTSLLSPENPVPDNHLSRLSLNFGEELKSRVNMRMKAGE